MLELAQQLSYHLAVIDGGASSQLVSFGQRIWALSNIAGAAQASLNSMLNPLMNIGNAWSQREQQINNISRTLRQYQYVGQSVADINRQIGESMAGATQSARDAEFTRVYGNQFNQARAQTRQVLREMNTIAAILPGETADYIQAFNMALPFLSQSKGMNLGRAVNLTSYLTAGGIAGGIDAGQSARDLMQFLTMGPHLMDRSWTEVWSQYATLHGRKVSAERIRGMTMEDRVQVLEEIKSQLMPMMNAMGNSFEAATGTFNSLRHELYLTATEPIFESFKKIISAVNEQLARFAPTVGIVSNFFANVFARNLDKLAERITGSGDEIQKASKNFFRYATIADSAFRRIYSWGERLVTQHPEQIGQAVGADVGFLALGGLVGGPLGLLLGASIGRAITMQSGMYGASGTAAAGAIDMILPALFSFAEAAYNVYNMLVRITSSLIATALPSLLMLLGSGVSLLFTTLTPILELFVQIVAALLLPVLALTAIFITGLITVFVGLAEVIKAVASFFGQLMGSGASLSEAYEGFALFLQDLISGLRDWLHDLGMISDEDYAAALRRAAEPSEEPDWLKQLRTALTATQGTANLSQTGRAPPQQRPQTHQDFRYSRFDITQKFAEGFDPDRVASAFASDLSAMAEQRLESGFQPAFTTP